MKIFTTTCQPWQCFLEIDRNDLMLLCYYGSLQQYGALNWNGLDLEHAVKHARKNGWKLLATSM